MALIAEADLMRDGDAIGAVGEELSRASDAQMSPKAERRDANDTMKHAAESATLEASFVAQCTQVEVLRHVRLDEGARPGDRTGERSRA